MIYIHIAILLIMCSQCKPKEYYPRVGSVSEAGDCLWSITDNPWGWRISFERVKELIEDKGAEVDHIDESASDGQTPLLKAAGALKCLREKNHFRAGEIDSMELEAIKIVKYLAKKGANIHATTLILKLNALHMAANGGREKMIPVLVKLGLDINSRNGDPDYGGTVLWHAITAGDLATVKAVVEAGADINLCLFDGNSPLDWAEAYARSKKTSWHRPYDDQDSIAAYMQSIGAKHGKNNFKGYLYYDENKK